MSAGSVGIIMWLLVKMHHVSKPHAEQLAYRLGYACQLAQVARDGGDDDQLTAAVVAGNKELSRVKKTRGLELKDVCHVSDFRD